MKRSLSFMIVLVCMSTLVSAQQYLYIKKKGEMPAERLSVHDVIKLRTENGDDWIKGRIQAIAKESLTLNDQVFSLSKY